MPARVFAWLARTVAVPAAIAILLAHAAPAQGKRIALVIGNSIYDNVSDLPNPVNDATDIGKALERLGFSVTLQTDLSLSEMTKALRNFRVSSSDAEQAVIYYAGHGIEIDFQNYLIPVDARLSNDFDAKFEAIELEDVVAATGGAEKLGLVILDACRNNPFVAQMTRSSATRSIGRGLAIVEPTGNTLVAYAAKAGTVAADGVGRNSPYAEALIDALSTPGLEVLDVFRLVRDKVLTTTQGVQEPFVYGSLSAEKIYLGQPPAPPVQSLPAAPAVPAAPANTAIAELDLWLRIKDSRSAAELEAFIQAFPESRFRDEARARIAALQTETPPSLPPVDTAAQRNLDNGAAAPAETDQPEFRASADIVREVQARLNVLNLKAGAEDGVLGPRSRAAIRAFQRSSGMAETGEITSGLLDRLRAAAPDEALAARRAATEPAQRPARTGDNVVVGRPYCNYNELLDVWSCHVFQRKSADRLVLTSYRNGKKNRTTTYTRTGENTYRSMGGATYYFGKGTLRTVVGPTTQNFKLTDRVMP